MKSREIRVSDYELEKHGLRNLGTVYWNLSTGALYEEIVRRRCGFIAHLGPVVVRTGHHTGRSPEDRFIVREPSSESRIWWGKVNKPFPEERFTTLFHRLQGYVQGRDLFVQDCHVGADPRYQIPVRIITESAWQSLFARNMFLQIRDPEQLRAHEPKFTVLAVPQFHAIPEIDGTNSEAFILVNFGKQLILIGGTSYAGEIKKSFFTVMNYLLPLEEVLPMHCSANVGTNDDVALFFGLSGTGKTTLSADPERRLLGDDEHGWSNEGIFNFEGGCYAKVIKLSREAEPQIYECTRKFGTILENVAVDPRSRRIDLNDASLTENTRAAYPIPHIEGALRSGKAGHPAAIIMLTCDAFGIMPPVAKLTKEQALYHFLSGYTAKVAGTERGLGNEPQATFSACFGAPFMALPPPVYSKLLGEKIERHKVSCWLVNTGWIGGGFGVGKRISIAYTRAIIRAILEGKLANAPMREDPVFGVFVPTECPEVPSDILDPRGKWADRDAYDKAARDLAARFRNNFAAFEKDVPPEVQAIAPKTEAVASKMG
ncbi:MAG: phosphoenolpyruvate carboxykinase (ATP) [Candidatus Abyssobacteria bacterium SURF_17]|uniref:Phosphoenolpyruvate carboxykinase (ATP) n=1 Tax=Candidatus Abyssobacteria bacterium SURF_17 TaxID=2093361 RepID=A0A419ET39_9BACT|nr:MAG: phosphoenolpyruvate carboxykinase (ATP) [Candidatus Abyssubacteria bacterium SURF_17]